MADLPLTPMIIGITGKRDLQGKDQSVRDSIRAAFDLLDRSFPLSRKLLLTAVAAGSDTIAAEEALARKDWSIIAVLPLPLDLYMQDFAEHEARNLRRIVSEPRVRVRTLAPLTDPRTGKPFSADELRRVAGKPNPERSDHYEQVGLFIAERCTLLIAVMNASEKPDRIGGTARIVEYRLHGTLDEAADRVTTRSSELYRYSELNFPETGPVWLVNLASAGNQSVALRSIELWTSERPRSDWVAVKRAIQFWRSREPHTTANQPTVEHRRWRYEGELTKDLHTPRWIEDLNSLTGRVGRDKTKLEQVASTELADASARLRQLRQMLSVIQTRKKLLYTSTMYALGGLFVCAVLALELHLEFHWSILWYLGLFGVTLAVYTWGRATLLQQFVEDHRAIAEALRVQLVWWDSGMVGPDYRVDRFFLATSTGALGLLRAGLRNLILAAQLEGVSSLPELAASIQWVNGQIRYFVGKIRERETRLSWLRDITWFCFIASAGMVVLLLRYAEENLAPAGSWLLRHPLEGIVFAFGMMILTRGLSLLGKLHKGSGTRLAANACQSVAAFVWGALVAAVLFQIGERHQVGHDLVAVAAVGTASLAGAFRFFVERLGWEPELHSYRDALDVFVRAEKALAWQGTEASILEKQRIIFDLGRLALQENEWWLRAHRIRRIEPMH